VHMQQPVTLYVCALPFTLVSSFFSLPHIQLLSFSKKHTQGFFHLFKDHVPFRFEIVKLNDFPPR
jgi:hypothetical protein